MISLADKLSAFLDMVEREARGDAAARDRTLTRLDSFSVVQLLVSERFGFGQEQMALLASMTLVVAPVLLLLFFQVRFLPYHDYHVTTWHRLLVGADILMIRWLWPTHVGLSCGVAIGLVWGTLVGIAPLPVWLKIVFVVACTLAVLWPTYMIWLVWIMGWVSAAVVLVFSWGLATVPDEWLEIRGLLTPVRSALFDGEVDETTQHPSSFFSRRLILPDEDFLTVCDEISAMVAASAHLRVQLESCT